MSPKELLRAAIITAFLIAPGLTFAGFAGRLSLDEALKLALERNPQALEARAAIKESQSAHQEAVSQLYPKLSATVQYSTSDDIRTQLPDSNQALIRLDYDILQGGKLLADLQRLRALEGASTNDLRLKALQIELSVKSSYYRGLAAAEQAQEWKESQSEFEFLLKFVEPKFTVGSVPEYDYAKIRLSIEDFDLQFKKSRAAFEHELFSLGELTGASPPQELLPLAEPRAPPSLKVEDLLPEIHQSHPEVLAAEGRVQAQQSELSGFKRERWPTLKLSADYGYSGFTANDLSLGWGFTATLNLPILDFGTISSRVSQAQARLIAQESRLEGVRLRFRTDLSDAVASVQVSWNALEAARQAIPISEKAYRSSLRRYRTGIAQMTELNDAHDLWIRARVTLSQAKAEYRIAWATLGSIRNLPSEGASP